MNTVIQIHQLLPKIKKIKLNSLNCLVLDCSKMWPSLWSDYELHCVDHFTHKGTVSRVTRLNMFEDIMLDMNKCCYCHCCCCCRCRCYPKLLKMSGKIFKRIISWVVHKQYFSLKLERVEKMFSKFTSLSFSTWPKVACISRLIHAGWKGFAFHIFTAIGI